MDISVDSLSNQVVQRVAALTEQEATDLPPLYETLDPEALDRLVNSVETDNEVLLIQFTYANHQVTVDANGIVNCNPTG